MDQRRFWVIVIVFSAALTGLVYAEPPNEDVTIWISSPYFRCIRPETVSCITYTEEDKQRCEQCREWTTVVTVKPSDVVAIDPSRYRRNQRSANLFLKEILTKYYEMSPAHAERLMPPSIRDLYDDPAKSGWTEIDEKLPGAIMFDRHRVAFILGDDLLVHKKQRPRTIRTALRVVAEGARNLLYPSARQGGIRKSEEDDLFNDPASPPKIALPKAEPAKSNIPVAWNGWFEQLPAETGDRPRFEPLRRLEPGQKYEFVAHFAGFNYRNLYGVPAGMDALSRMTNLARTSDKSTERLTAVILADEAGLHAERNLVQFDFDIAALRRWDKSPSVPEGDPMAYLAEHKSAPFVFGELRVQVTTSDREGLTTLGVSVWDADGWPVDELTVPICVARNETRAKAVCPERQLMGRGYGSYDLERMSLPTPPAGAFHFVDLGRGGVNVAFRRNDKPDCRDVYVWKIQKTEGQLVAALSSIANDFAVAADEEERTRVGERMRDLLFAAGEPNNIAARRARGAFIEFARDHMRHPPASGKTAPLLFVRMTPRHKDDEPLPMVRVLPFGMIKVDETVDSYLGFFFRIESPLSRQIADDESDCDARWKLIVPPLASSLRHLREHVDRNIVSWMRGAEVLDDMRNVRKYLNKEVRDGERTALVVLGHYGIPKPNAPARIRFERDYFSSDEIRRVYKLPSIALLSGCGTAEIGAEDFVQQLNMHGVDTVVAATTTVSGEMGVQFLECFESTLPRGRGRDGAPLNEIVFDSVQCLRDRASDIRDASYGRPHGSAALAFTLLGNGRLPLCVTGDAPR